MSIKKDLSFHILQILKKYSSKESRLSKADILKHLYEDNGIDCDRRTVGASLRSLITHGYPIRFEKRLRGNKEYKTAWYLEPSLSREDSERLAISALSSSTVSDALSRWVLSRVTEGESEPSELPDIFYPKKDNIVIDHLFKSIFAVYDAIKSNHMLSFSVIEYTDTERKHFEEDLGRVIEYLVKPFGIVYTESGYYLFGELGDSEKYRYFDLERIYDLKETTVPYILDRAITPPLPLNRLESREMRFSEREKAVFTVNRSLLGVCYKMLYPLYTVKCFYGNFAEIEVFEDLTLLKSFLLSLGAGCEVLSPTKLRRGMAIELQNAASRYKEVRRLRGSL